MRRYYKSKAIWFSLLLAVFGVVETQLGLFSDYMSKELFGAVTLLVSVAVAVLRVLTALPTEGK